MQLIVFIADVQTCEMPLFLYYNNYNLFLLLLLLLTFFKATGLSYYKL